VRPHQRRNNGQAADAGASDVPAAAFSSFSYKGAGFVFPRCMLLTLRFHPPFVFVPSADPVSSDMRGEGRPLRASKGVFMVTPTPYQNPHLHPHTRSPPPPLPHLHSPATRQAPPPNAPLLTLFVSRASCSLYPVGVPGPPCSTCARWCRTSAPPHPVGAHRRRQRQGEPCWQGRRQERMVVSPPCSPFEAHVRPSCSMRPQERRVRGAV
jgi:hypothetical protein